MAMDQTVAPFLKIFKAKKHKPLPKTHLQAQYLTSLIPRRPHFLPLHLPSGPGLLLLLRRGRAELKGRRTTPSLRREDSD